ncbi:MAG: FAD synthetase family protein [Erysipelotrichaceae bacterium]|nr:FAD synthetase family protein [Erysipelotrichaceae bacterium]
MSKRPVVIRIRYEELPVDLPECVACIGFFDSLHRGHQQLIRRCIEEAEAFGLPAVLICFDKDPLEVITGKHQFHILSYHERIAKINELGIGKIIMFEFDERFMNMDSHLFVSDYLNRMHLRKLICGFDFRFGYQGRGDTETLEQEGKFETIVIPQISFYQLKISSSRIKSEIVRGNLKLVQRLLGYRYYLDVKVINIENMNGKYLVHAKCPDQYKVLPPNGTYQEGQIILKENYFNILYDKQMNPGDIIRLEF